MATSFSEPKLKAFPLRPRSPGWPALMQTCAVHPGGELVPAGHARHGPQGAVASGWPLELLRGRSRWPTLAARRRPAAGGAGRPAGRPHLRASPSTARSGSAPATAAGTAAIPRPSTASCARSPAELQATALAARGRVHRLARPTRRGPRRPRRPRPAPRCSRPARWPGCASTCCCCACARRAFCSAASRSTSTPTTARAAAPLRPARAAAGPARPRRPARRRSIPPRRPWPRLAPPGSRRAAPAGPTRRAGIWPSSSAPPPASRFTDRFDVTFAGGRPPAEPPRRTYLVCHPRRSAWRTLRQPRPVARDRCCASGRGW